MDKCFFLPILALLFLTPFSGEISAQSNQETSEKEVSGRVYRCKPGPWGDLTYYYIYLEAPQDFVERFPLPSPVTKWVFPGATIEDLRVLFTKAGLSQALQDYMLDPGKIVDENRMLAVFPPLPDLEAMTPSQRQIIYSELAKYAINEYHVDPVMITAGDVDEWLKDSTLSAEIKSIIHKYVYYRGDLMVFSDLSAVLNYIDSASEARNFFKTITRTRTIVLRLEVNEKSDLTSIANYWTGRNRFKDILPILTSVSETENVNVLDVIHLMPSMVRRYLYTYPPIDLAINGRMPDCHWTSLNFFNHWGKGLYLDSRLAASTIKEDYEHVEPPYEFGDVLMFMPTGSGKAIHSCVYLADDIVFTKNGENLATPWLLMKLDDVRKIYFHSSIGDILGFRMNKLVQGDN